jgi:hypothetical protein
LALLHSEVRLHNLLGNEGLALLLVVIKACLKHIARLLLLYFAAGLLNGDVAGVRREECVRLSTLFDFFILHNIPT